MSPPPRALASTYLPSKILLRSQATGPKVPTKGAVWPPVCCPPSEVVAEGALKEPADQLHRFLARLPELAGSPARVLRFSAMVSGHSWLESGVRRCGGRGGPARGA